MGMATRRGGWPGVVLLGAVLAGCAGHLVYPSGPFHGRVVDAETGQPLVGAAVVAVWRREAPGPGHPVSSFHDAQEVVTNLKGEFALPRTTHMALVGEIAEPDVHIYFPGYRPFLGGRGFETPASTEEQPKTVALPRIRTREERLQYGATGLPVDTSVPDARIPNLIRLVNEYRRQLGLEPIHEKEP
jgi:hypothetical protein